MSLNGHTIHLSVEQLSMQQAFWTMGTPFAANSMALITGLVLTGLPVGSRVG
jgi:hypothetical protein